MATTGTALGARFRVRAWQRMAIAGTLAASLLGVGFAAGRILPSDPTEAARMVPRYAGDAHVFVGIPSGGFSAQKHHHRVKWG